MAFNFSLTQDLFTPMRPPKVEQLFSPTPQKVLKDVTYQIPTNPKSQLDHSIKTSTTLGLSNLRFPRQSTGLKVAPEATSYSISDDSQQTVASDLILDGLLPKTLDSSNYISQYRPFYILKDRRPMRSTCFHPNGDVFVVGSNSKVLKICAYPPEEDLKEETSKTGNPMQPEVLFTFTQIHRGSVYCVSFNNSGNLLATGSNDQTVHIIKYNSEKHLPQGNEYKLTTHNGTIRDLCFLKNSGVDKDESSLLLSGGAGDFEINLTDCNVMKSVSSFKGHSGTIMSLHSWDDANRFVSGSFDGTIRLWDIRTKCCQSIITTNSSGAGGGERPSADIAGGDCEPTSGQSNQVDGEPVGVVRVEPSGKLLASGHRDGRCMLFDVRGGRIVQQFKAHDDEIRTLNYSPKTYYLLTGSYDKQVKLIDLQGDLTRKLPSVEIAKLEDKVVQTAWHPIDYNFVTTSADGTASLWTIPEVVAF